ncbi:MAG: hypothetical protein ACYTFI_27630, partial [Planctomycetota bacterium]
MYPSGRADSFYFFGLGVDAGDLRLLIVGDGQIDRRQGDRVALLAGTQDRHHLGLAVDELLQLARHPGFVFRVVHHLAREVGANLCHGHATAGGLDGHLRVLLGDPLRALLRDLAGVG